MDRSKSRQSGSRKIRYAVVGQGYIAQIAVLPAFEHARRNSELVALFSDDPAKKSALGKKYGVSQTYGYDEYESRLKSENIDAVYIALPNNMHCGYAVRAAHCGVHVLCEKPMAVTERECETMIQAAERNRVKLMIAYRLHFESANLAAIAAVQSGKLGEPQIFNSTFTLSVEPPNIRVEPEMGGGTLYDIGIYCINAARYLFRDEPLVVQAAVAGKRGGVEESSSAILRFPGDRLATFSCSFGGSKVSAYQLVGTEGDLRLDPAYEYAGARHMRLTIVGKTKERSFDKQDQFGPELVYFSDCVLEDRDPEPSGREGLADVRIVQALYRSARTGRAIELAPYRRANRPVASQEIRRPPVAKPKLVHARSPSGAH